MSRRFRALTPEEEAALDPTKSYHITGERYSEPVPCGPLEPTDTWGTIHSIEVHILKCSKCGKEYEVSDYDIVWTGPDIPYQTIRR